MSADSYQALDRFLTLEEVRTMFSVSRSTIWRWHTERGLKIVRVGGVTRIRESDLQAFLARHAEKATSSVESRFEGERSSAPGMA